MPTSLLDAPPEILQRIALFAILSAPLGPPRDLYNLSQLCRKAHRILSGNCPEFYADILAQKFDAPAIIRRFGISAFQENAKIELQRRFAALDIFRKGRLDDPSLTEAFWIAYLMLEEDSTTSLKNVKQLRWANLPAFLDSFFQKRLYKGSVTNNGWPLPNVVNSLAIVLFWLLSSPFRRETPEMRDTILQLLTPFVFAAFRYPIFGSAESYFDLSTSHCCSTSTGVHGPYPPPPLLPQNITYFGRIRREAHVPCVSVFASLSYFTRHETMSPMIPPHLIEAKRQTRVEADALGLSGPTLDDMEHFIHQCQTRFVDYSMGRIQKLKSPPSSIVGQPSYQLGTLTGRWEGSYIMPFLDDYHSWLNELQAPSHFPTTGRFPLYITLQEHFICKPKSIYPWNNVERGTLNAWLPSGLEWVEKPNGIEISDEYGNAKAFYETFQHNQTPTCEERDVGDVIVTGKTDSRHAAAWGAFHVLGRIRLVDGLVVLARESLFDAGTSLLRGYVTSSQNFVGRLKGESSGTEPAAWEGTFSLCNFRKRFWNKSLFSLSLILSLVLHQPFHLSSSQTAISTPASHLLQILFFTLKYSLTSSTSFQPFVVLEHATPHHTFLLTNSSFDVCF